MSVTATLIGQISSAYSLPRVRPSGSVIAAARMIACQPQKWSDDRKSLANRAFTRRWVE